MAETGPHGTAEVRWKVTDAPGFVTPVAVVTGRDPAGMGLQVAVADWTSPTEPSREILRKLHAERQGKKVFPLVVLLRHQDDAFLMGPGHDAGIIHLPISQAERVLQAALDESDGLAAHKRLAVLQRATTSSSTAGVTNEGLFAGHYLATSAPRRADWRQAAERAGPLLSLRHETLIKNLGFTTKRTAGHALLLSAQTATRAVAVLLETEEQFDAAAPRFHLSPVAYGLRVAARAEVPWLIVLRGSQIRLYPARPGVGVGQKGQADTWFELDLAVLDDDQAALLPLVFSAEALGPGGSTDQLLEGSAQFAVELGQRLRDRIYDRAVPRLAQGLAAQLPAMGKAVDSDGLDLAYRLSLKVLFRLLFQSYAEDRGLLPYGRNARYDRNALKTWAADLAHDPEQPFDPHSTAIWDDLAQVWRVIDSGDSAWNVPAYNGGLFGADPALNPDGALLARIRLSNDIMGPVLAALLVDEMDDGASGSVDFRSLSVREFGTIYEGLLESSLSLAPTDLTLDSKGTYLPAGAGDQTVVAAGEVYFHSASGQRKSTGTYFTPHIVVEHLLTRALEPVLADHLARIKQHLDDGDEAAAAEMFFDLRVADLAMGSAHFLTAAIDHIEAGMRDFLTEHPIPAIQDELRQLEQAATAALGEDAAVAEIEPAALLRRQIARRCIYGLDLNPMAVELARLAIWVTTFVPGLPMSSLNHTLVCANSLTGVGTVDEALAVLDPAAGHGQMSIFSEAIEDELAKARELLIDAANASEATKAEATAAAQAAIEARDAAEPARLLFDAVVAARLGLLTPTAYSDPVELRTAAADPEIQTAVDAVQPAHFPYLFPEVFLRDAAGFDVILGNPPWEKLHVEEHIWWSHRFPGLQRGMPQAEKNKAIKSYRATRPDLVREYEADKASATAQARIVAAGDFPGIGAAHLDLMAAFAWRFLRLTNGAGALGVVLPRTSLIGASLAMWRQVLLMIGDLDLTLVVNTARWCFDMEARYTVALVAGRKVCDGIPLVRISGPYGSRTAFIEGDAASLDVPGVTAAEVVDWSAGAAIPMLPDPGSLGIFTTMRKQPNLSADVGWHFRPVQGDLNAAHAKSLFDFDLNATNRAHEDLRVWTGRTFNLWEPDSGLPYAYADRVQIIEKLQQKRLVSAKREGSPFVGLAGEDLLKARSLPMHGPRIAFRDVTKWDNTRTMVCCLVPPEVVLVHKAPFLLRQLGDERDEAFLLGVLSSIPFDWYARRFVEVTMSFALLNAMPVPRPPEPSEMRDRVVEVAGRLAAVDDRYAEWAAAVGVATGSVTTAAERADLIAELDAVVSLLYGLTRDQVVHVFETFHRGWDYGPRLDAVLFYYDQWQGTD